MQNTFHSAGILSSHTPKDNPCLEKFNHTVQREWLSFSVIGLDDINEANIDLTEWLVKYNSIRPHQALDYKTPLDYAYEQSPQLVPMTQPEHQLDFLLYNKVHEKSLTYFSTTFLIRV